MAKKLSPDMNKGASFTYNNTTITLGPIQWNPYFECWMMDYRDSLGNAANRIPIRAGVNILQNYQTVVPAMFAINKNNIYSDPTINFDFDLYIIDSDDEET